MTALASVAGSLRLALEAWHVAVEVVDETGSTNADLMAGVRAGDVPLQPRLLVAGRQTAGRGRLGRTWHGEAGASLTFSLAWPLGGADASGLSLAVGVAVADALDADSKRIALKWPNDLWLIDAQGAGRKLGGILIETTPSASGRVAVIGIGINVFEQPVEHASTGVAWLREIEADATLAGTLLRAAPALLEGLARFGREGFAAFASGFAARDLLRGQAVRCSGATGRVVEGVAAGIAPGGDLLVETVRGVESIASGEVSVRLAADPVRASAPQGHHEGLAC